MSAASEINLVTFPASSITFACTSDTHNDSPLDHVPAADIFLHAGDLTDDGTPEELQAAFKWISKLPHKVKVVVAGNHDVGLDPAHSSFNQPSLDLYTSKDALNHGIHYIDREVKTVAFYLSPTGSKTPIRVYGNPCTPDFLSSNYAFTYLPHPDKLAMSSWTTAPNAKDDVDVWVCHCPPKGILDEIPIAPLTGCEVMRHKVVKAKPRMCVFGHYHCAYGRKLLGFDKEGNECEAGKVVIGEDGFIELTKGGATETLFLNAAWMTMQKGQVDKRNKLWRVRFNSRRD